VTRFRDLAISVTIGVTCAALWLVSWPMLVWWRTRRYRGVR
jgi:hypothetical protein